MAAKTHGERWEIVRQIDEGGQSHVFEVVDRTDRAKPPRVLKRLKNVLRLERFARELAVIRRLDHPNVIKVVDSDLQAPKPYIVMELFAGGSLAPLLEHWAEQPLSALNLFRQICSGVAAAHAAGIVHRDLKPENVLLRSPAGPAVVSDFGICHVDGERLTLTDEAVGPRLYMAPELERRSQ